jgi:hypothetical protein
MKIKQRKDPQVLRNSAEHKMFSSLGKRPDNTKEGHPARTPLKEWGHLAGALQVALATKTTTSTETAKVKVELTGIWTHVQCIKSMFKDPVLEERGFAYEKEVREGAPETAAWLDQHRVWRVDGMTKCRVIWRDACLGYMTSVALNASRG